MKSVVSNTYDEICRTIRLINLVRKKIGHSAMWAAELVEPYESVEAALSDVIYALEKRRTEEAERNSPENVIGERNDMRRAVKLGK